MLDLPIPVPVIRYVILPFLSTKCVVNYALETTQNQDELINYAYSRLGARPKRKTKKGQLTELANLASYLCESCEEAPAKARPWVHFDDEEARNIRICDECKQLPQYKLICKTTALRKYKTKQRDLNKLPFIEAKNPHFSRASSMILYRELDVVALKI